MSSRRLKNRVESARVISSGILEKYKLMFHKVSDDGSGKCDAYFTENPADKMYGVVYSIKKDDLARLDSYEGLGYGYEKKDVVIKILNDEEIKVLTYIATDIEAGLKPYGWYKYHVLHGAVENVLPPDYISFIDSFRSKADPKKGRAVSTAISILIKCKLYNKYLFG